MEEQIPERLSKIEKPLFYYHASADGDLKKMQERIKKMDDEIALLKKPSLNYQFDHFIYKVNLTAYIKSII